MAVEPPWALHKDFILASWIKKTPCTRPWAWWEVDAPEQCQKISGTGTRLHERMKIYYRDMKNRYGVEVERDVFDPNDPPIYESQAAFLERHGLLTAAERAYLKKHPELMTPETETID